MKKATVFTTAVDVYCPHCEEPIEYNNGSYIWEIHDPELTSGNIIECQDCGEYSQIPKTVKPEKL